jgi:hypothetical protein
MKKYLILLPLLFLIGQCGSHLARGADIITVTIQVTDLPVDTDTLTVNGSTRTWKTTVTAPNSQIATAVSMNISATNLYLQIAGNPFLNFSVGRSAADKVTLRGAPGIIPSISQAGAWATITYATNALTSARVVRVPASVEDSSVRASIADDLVVWLNLATGQTLGQDSYAMGELVGLNNDQEIDGQKHFTALTAANPILDTPVTTNLVNYGNAISSPGAGADSEQFGSGSTANADASLAIGKVAGVASGADGGIAIGSLAYVATGASAGIAIGSEAEVTEINGTAIGTDADANHENSTAIGYGAQTTRDNQTVIGSGTVEVLISGGLTVVGASTNNWFQGTNNFAPGSSISFGRYNVSTLANGNNDDVPVGTNVNVYVSGPSGAFTIRGINAGNAQRDGAIVIIENDTGQNMTVGVEGGASGNQATAGNRITSNSGADVSSTGNCTAMFKFNATSSRWKLISFND